MAFDRATIENLRSFLEPTRERYDLATVMHRWAEIVRDFRGGEIEPDAPIENLDQLVMKLVGGHRALRRKKVEPRIRRQRVDLERDAAIGLAEIFHEFSRAQPTRIFREGHTNKNLRDKSSRYYEFAKVAFEAVGLTPSESAFREATERRKRSRGYSKRNWHQLLWGGLSPRGNRAPLMTWRERRIRRRKKLPPK